MASSVHSFKLGSSEYVFRHWFEFIYLMAEIFWCGEYRFSSRSAKPRIVDCGAHLGLSILYFCQQYPDCQILAFEPDPHNLAVLEQNISHNKRNVELQPVALGHHRGTTTFYKSADDQPSWGNSIKPNVDGNSRKQAIQVKVEKLSSYLKEPVAFLKMDIEGMELEVLTEASSKLHLIDQLVIESHDSVAAPGQTANAISKLLTQHNFMVRVNKPRRIALGEWLDGLRGAAHSDIHIIYAQKKRV